MYRTQQEIDNHYSSEYYIIVLDNHSVVYAETVVKEAGMYRLINTLSQNKSQAPRWTCYVNRQHVELIESAIYGEPYTP